jgi:hypothetical protein
MSVGKTVLGLKVHIRCDIPLASTRGFDHVGTVTYRALCGVWVIKYVVYAGLCESHTFTSVDVHASEWLLYDRIRRLRRFT